MSLSFSNIYILKSLSYISTCDICICIYFLFEPGAHQLGTSNYAARSKNPIVPASLALAVQGLHTGFYMTAGDLKSRAHACEPITFQPSQLLCLGVLSQEKTHIFCLWEKS